MSSLVLLSCNSHLKGATEGKVTVGYTEYRPLIWKAGEARPAGFVVQVMEEAARRENLTIEWVSRGSTALDTIRGGHAQIWPVFPTGTPAAEGVHVTAPWWRTGFSLIVPGDDTTTEASDWQGTVGVQDSPSNVQAAATMRRATPKLYPTLAAAVDGFCRGETGAVLVGYFRGYNLLNRRPPACRDIPFQLLMLPEAGSDLSLMSASEDSALAERFRRQLDEMAVDGTLMRIALQFPGVMPGIAVHLSRLSHITDDARRRDRTMLGLMVGLITFALLMLKLIVDRRRRKRAEEALRSSEDKLRLALVAASMTQWDWEEARETIADPEERKRVEAQVRSALAAGSALEMEYRIAGEDGRERWILVKAHAAPLRDRLTGIAIDITHRKAAEMERAEVEERFRRAVLESPVPMMIYADDGAVLNLSRSWTQLAGYTVQDIPTLRHWNEIALQRTSSLPELGEMPVVTRGGEVRTWLLSRSGLGRLSDGRHLALLAAVDLTERKLAEEELRKASQELEHYAYAASHDLQEPMRVIGLYSQLLLRKHREELTSQAQNYFETITREARRMTGIVDGLISYSRLVCDTDPIPRQTVSLAAVVETAVADTRSAADASGAIISVGPLPMVQGDAHALNSVVCHLLSNAIKYVPAGVRPEIRVSALREGDVWIVSVRDNGVGIPVEYHERIWGVFKRLHGHDIPGTGIGLAVVRKVVQQHGGRAWVESSGRGGGSVFRFTLRAPKPAPAETGDRIPAARI